MLNRIIFLFFAILVSFNSFALTQAEFNKTIPIEVKPIALKIREPFTSLAIAHLKIVNKTDTDIEIKKVTSDQARHVDFYKTYENDFGAQQVKRTKNIFIKANKTTLFNDGEIKIMLTGLEKKYLPGDEVLLKFYLVDYNRPINAYIKVHPSYK